jgi:hypothetical protein
MAGGSMVDYKIDDGHPANGPAGVCGHWSVRCTGHRVRTPVFDHIRILVLDTCITTPQRSHSYDCFTYCSSNGSLSDISPALFVPKVTNASLRIFTLKANAGVRTIQRSSKSNNIRSRRLSLSDRVDLLMLKRVSHQQSSQSSSSCRSNSSPRVELESNLISPTKL